MSAKVTPYTRALHKEYWDLLPLMVAPEQHDFRMWVRERHGPLLGKKPRFPHPPDLKAIKARA